MIDKAVFICRFSVAELSYLNQKLLNTFQKSNQLLPSVINAFNNLKLPFLASQLPNLVFSCYWKFQQFNTCSSSYSIILRFDSQVDGHFFLLMFSHMGGGESNMHKNSFISFGSPDYGR